MTRCAKAKAKATKQKSQSSGGYLWEGKHVQTPEEIAERTLNILRILGNQRFALPQFSDYFDLWLANLRDALSEFESSPPIGVDDQFLKERSQILSNVELDLEKRRREEASGENAVKSLSGTRILLEQVEREMLLTRRKSKGEKTVKSGACLATLMV